MKALTKILTSLIDFLSYTVMYQSRNTEVETQQVPGLVFEADHGRCIFSGVVAGKQDIRFST